MGESSYKTILNSILSHGPGEEEHRQDPSEGRQASGDLGPRRPRIRQGHPVRQDRGQVRIHPLVQRRPPQGRGPEQLREIMTKGDLVPMFVVLDLLAEAMLSKLDGSKGYLIDGYPREVQQGKEFEAEILPCTQILYFDVSDATMTERLLNRGKSSGRADDNEDTIKLRLNTFHQHSKPVIEAYASKCKSIPAERDPNDIFADVCATIDSMK